MSDYSDRRPPSGANNAVSHSGAVRRLLEVGLKATKCRRILLKSSHQALSGH